MSWEDVCKVNGIQYDTFQATCRYLGLLHDDAEWNTVLEDAALTSMCQQMRELFAALLLFCNPAEPAILFEQHNPQMGDDFICRIQAFVDAPGGMGKTFCFNLLLAAVRAQGQIALAVASSGIAATVLTGGRMFHSHFKAPLQPDATSVCSIKGQSTLAEVIRHTKLIIWDEAPMAHCHLLEALDRTLHDLMDSDLPFSGKVIVLGGDFRQILPVMKRALHVQIVAACVQQSLLWHHSASSIYVKTCACVKMGNH